MAAADSPIRLASREFSRLSFDRRLFGLSQLRADLCRPSPASRGFQSFERAGGSSDSIADGRPNRSAFRRRPKACGHSLPTSQRHRGPLRTSSCRTLRTLDRPPARHASTHHARMPSNSPHHPLGAVAPRRKSGRPLNYSRSLLDAAVSDIQARKARGETASVRDTAVRFSVPKSTLHRHLRIAVGQAVAGPLPTSPGPVGATPILVPGSLPSPMPLVPLAPLAAAPEKASLPFLINGHVAPEGHRSSGGIPAGVQPPAAPGCVVATGGGPDGRAVVCGYGGCPCAPRVAALAAELACLQRQVASVQAAVLPLPRSFPLSPVSPPSAETRSQPAGAPPRYSDGAIPFTTGGGGAPVGGSSEAYPPSAYTAGVYSAAGFSPHPTLSEPIAPQAAPTVVPAAPAAAGGARLELTARGASGAVRQ